MTPQPPAPPPAQVVMNAAQIYALARQTGFPPTVAVTMTAIALRESGGLTNAFNGTASTGDRSYGLWQINMAANTAYRLRLFGVTDEKQLFEPAVNARAAFLLWGGQNRNLDVAWYITKPVYKERYEAHLPAAQAAALAET